jgi:hypothetical protein
VSHTRAKKSGRLPKAEKAKKPAPKWMREKFHMKQESHSDMMNEAMRRVATRD